MSLIIDEKKKIHIDKALESLKEGGQPILIGLHFNSIEFDYFKEKLDALKADKLQGIDSFINNVLLPRCY